MTELHPNHDRLIDFAEGQLVDRLEMEVHLAHCHECAHAVSILRKIHTLEQQQRIPQISFEELKRGSDRLLGRIAAQGQPPPSGNSPPMPASLFGAIGALGSAWAFGQTEAVPSLAAHDGHPPGPEVNHDESSAPLVTKEDQAASSAGEADQDTNELLARLQELLGSTSSPTDVDSRVDSVDFIEAADTEETSQSETHLSEEPTIFDSDAGSYEGWSTDDGTEPSDL